MEERLKDHDQVNTEPVKKDKPIAEDIPEYPKIYIPDYTQELKFLNKQVQVFIQSDHQQRIGAVMKNIEQKVSSIPKVIPVKHHHHFELKSRVVIIMICLLAIATTTSVFLFLNNKDLSKRNEALRDDATNYYFVRALYPQVAKTIANGLKVDPASFTKLADQAIRQLERNKNASPTKQK